MPEDRDLDPVEVLLDVGLDSDGAEAVLTGVGDVGPEDRERRIAEHGLEDVAAEVELVVAQRHRVVADRVERLYQRLLLQVAREFGAVRGIARGART